MKAPDAQRDLFNLPPPEIEPAPPRPEVEDLATLLPPGIRLGTMSWSYPGWRGIVYGPEVSPKVLADRGLTAYTKHPLLRAVEIDRTYYDPVSEDVFRRYAEQVPEDFRFLVKAHEYCTVFRFPTHARYGKKRGEPNHYFLDASYATDAVIGPLHAGLGAKTGALLFQFPPQDVGEPRAFAEQLYEFLRRLPKTIQYAVELRNSELLTPTYAAALADTGAVHCHNIWTAMPPVLTQIKQIPPQARRPLVIRWLLRQGDPYESAATRCAPFDRLVDEDPANRTTIARLVAKAERHGVPALVVVDNKAEGCAPESIVRLARAIVESGRPL